MARQKLILAILMLILSSAQLGEGLVSPFSAKACSARALIIPLCDGFKATRPRNPNSVAWLYANDPAFADEILGNLKHGQAVCGWKP